MSDLSSLARRALAALDLTSLDENDTPARIDALCAAAALPQGAPAALCVYPEFILAVRIGLERRGLGAVRIATVVNFPDGSSDVARAERETRRALGAGADEIDLVLPYAALLAGDTATGARMVAACKAACGERVLKVILETGVLGEPEPIRRASLLAIDAGADFIKTSTGKVAVNATPAAAEVMLEAIHERGGRVGFKAAGGIRTVADAGVYFALADGLLGADWATPARFRLGASALLGDIRATLDGTTAATGSGY